MVLADSFYYQPVQIDTINTRVNADLFAKEGDANGRGMVVQITENGMIKDTTGITLRLQWSHISVVASGFTDFEVVDATKGLYKVKYPTSMLHRGKVEAFIRITDNGILSGTRNLLITVERMVGSDETIEASDDFSALQTALIQLDAWNVTIGGKVDTWEADMEATKQLYIDTLTAAEAAYPQDLVSLQGQLAETTTKIQGKPVRALRNVVSFYFDDGSDKDYTIIKPIAIAKGIPISIGCVSDFTANNTAWTMNIDKLKELQDLGWEIQSHTKTHRHLNTLTEAEQEAEMSESKAYFEANGINVKNVMYPANEYNNTTLKLARKYYRSGLSSDLGTIQNNTPPLETYKLKRCLLEDHTIDALKARVDAMNNSWAIFYSHSATWGQAEIDKFTVLIDYVKSKNIDIMTIDNALDIFENAIDVGSHPSPTLRVGVDGTTESNNGMLFGGHKTGITNDTPITYFEKGKITVTAFNRSEASGIPIGSGVNVGIGTLTTYRLHLDDTYSYQKFQNLSVGVEGQRTWNVDTSAWNPWAYISPLKYYDYLTINFGTIPASGNVVINTSVTGLSSPGVVNVTFAGDVNTGIIYSASVPSAGNLRIKVYNLTASPIAVGSKGIYLSQFRNV